MKPKYEQALKSFPIGTINRLYELEKFEFTDFFYGGVRRFLMSNFRNLRILTGGSSELRLGDFGYNLALRMYLKFEKTTDIVDYEEIENDFVKLKLFSKKINVFSSRVIYVEILKKHLFYLT